MCKISLVTRSFVNHLIVIRSGGVVRHAGDGHWSGCVRPGRSGRHHPALGVICACWSRRRVLVIGYSVIILMGGATVLTVTVPV